jgi:hypothetical protein
MGSQVGRVAAIGASCPFPWVLANVPSPNPQQPFAAGNETGAPEFRVFLAGSARRPLVSAPQTAGREEIREALGEDS